MKKQELWQKIDAAYKQDKAIHPTFPDHIVAQAGVVNAQAGTLTKLCLNNKYKRSKNIDTIKNQAIMIIVQSIRFIENLKEENEPTSKKEDLHQVPPG